MKLAARNLARFGLSAMFLYAGYHKLLDPGGFATDIDNFRLLPATAVGVFSVALPPFEIVVALGLWTRRLDRGSALLCAAMLWTFAIAMVQAKIRGIDLDCGCFGSATTSEVGAWTIVRNFALGMLAAWASSNHSISRSTVHFSASNQPRTPETVP